MFRRSGRIPSTAPVPILHRCDVRGHGLRHLHDILCLEDLRSKWQGSDGHNCSRKRKPCLIRDLAAHLGSLQAYAFEYGNKRSQSTGAARLPNRLVQTSSPPKSPSWHLYSRALPLISRHPGSDLHRRLTSRRSPRHQRPRGESRALPFSTPLLSFPRLHEHTLRTGTPADIDRLGM